MIGGLEAVRVGFHGVGGGRAVDDAGKLGVHGDEGEFIDDFTDQLEFRFKVGGPNLADQDRFGIWFFKLHAHRENNQERENQERERVLF